jgi:DNA polymerase-3 subunit epsilon
VVDCETTGVYNSDRIVEIAVVTMDLDGALVETWESLVQPGRDVGASHIHGLTAASLRDAPSFADVAGDVAVRLHGACLAAHNLPFDLRMIGNEFSRLGAELVALSGIDTLTATGRRLGLACAEHGIELTGAHSALADAFATAELLKRVRLSCVAGGAAAAPTNFARGGRTLARSATAPVVIPDPPFLATLIARLDHGDVEAATLAYLEIVGIALADLRLEAAEREELRLLAASLGLDAAGVAHAHRRLVNELVDGALADHVVSDEELDVLMRVASALEVDPERVELRTRSGRTAASTVSIASGMTVVFTGDDPAHSREELTAHAERLGMTIGRGVTKSTDLLVAFESDSASGKAKKAHGYGVPIVSTKQFAAAGLGDVLDAVGTGGGRKVVTCPDCLTTWTVDARTSGQSRRRCDGCMSARPKAHRARGASPSPRPPGEDAGVYEAVPEVEQLTCVDCSGTWSRERTRGRKPHRCPECIGASQPLS